MNTMVQQFERLEESKEQGEPLPDAGEQNHHVVGRGSVVTEDQALQNMSPVREQIAPRPTNHVSALPERSPLQANGQNLNKENPQNHIKIDSLGGPSVGEST